MFSGKTFRKVYPLMALVTRFIIKTSLLPPLSKPSLLDLYNREQNEKRRKERENRRKVKEKTLFGFSEKGPRSRL